MGGQNRWLKFYKSLDSEVWGAQMSSKPGALLWRLPSTSGAPSEPWGSGPQRPCWLPSTFRRGVRVLAPGWLELHFRPGPPGGEWAASCWMPPGLHPQLLRAGTPLPLPTGVSSPGFPMALGGQAHRRSGPGPRPPGPFQLGLPWDLGSVSGGFFSDSGEDAVLGRSRALMPRPLSWGPPHYP